MAKKGKSVTDNQLADALIKAAGIKAEAARMVGLRRQTVQKRVDASPDLQAACKLGEEQLLDIAESKLKVSVKRGDNDMVRYYLDRKGKKRGYITSVNVGIDDTQAEAIVAGLGGDAAAFRAALARLGVAASEIP